MQNKRLPPLNALKTLEAVRETGSISGAAEKLAVSHSAVSQQLKHLQHWSERPILKRNGRSVTLTPAGESLASVVNGAFDAIRHELELLPIRFKQSISLSSPAIIAENILLPNLETFSRQNPEIAIHLSFSRVDKNASPIPDFEIHFQRFDRILSSEKVFLKGTAIPVISPSLLEKFDGSFDRVLSEAPLISDEDSRMWKTWFDENTAPNFKPRSIERLFFSDSLLMKKAALDGLGIALARTCCIQNEISSGLLIAISERSIDENWFYVTRIKTEKVGEIETNAVINWLEEIRNLV